MPCHLRSRALHSRVKYVVWELFTPLQELPIQQRRASPALLGLLKAPSPALDHCFPTSRSQYEIRRSQTLACPSTSSQHSPPARHPL